MVMGWVVVLVRRVGGAVVVVFVVQKVAASSGVVGVAVLCVIQSNIFLFVVCAS